MKFLRTVEVPGFARSDAQQIAPGEWEDDSEGVRWIAVETQLEGDEDQYPLEDVLDDFSIAIDAFEVVPPSVDGATVDIYEGEVDDIIRFRKELIGRRAIQVEENGFFRTIYVD